MGKKDNTLLVANVIQEGIRCCAKKCPGSKEDTLEKFFFSFPECDLNDEDSINRCRIWVRKAGNIEVTKYKLMDLPGKFFLCCSHFPDWTSKDDDHRYIPHDAIPAYFDCNPLSKSLMHAYAKIALGDDEKESEKNGDLLSPSKTPEPENITLRLSPVTPESEANDEAEKIIKEEPDISEATTSVNSESSQTPTLQTIESSVVENNSPAHVQEDKYLASCKTEDASTKASIEEDNLQLKKEEENQLETSIAEDTVNDSSMDKINNQSTNPPAKESAVLAEISKNPKVSQSAKKIEKSHLNIERRSTPARKAKQDAVYKIFNQPNHDEEFEENEPENKVPRLSLSRPATEIVSPSKLTSDPSRESRMSQETQDGSNQNSASPRPTSITTSPCLRTPHVIVNDVLEAQRKQAKTVIVSNNIIAKLSQPCEKLLNNVENNFGRYPPSLPKSTKIVSSPPCKSPVAEDREKDTDLRTILNAETGRFEVVSKSGIPITNESHIFTSDGSNGFMVEPVGRSVGVQTEVQNLTCSREILKIIDSDEKLSTFSGLPSYAVLDNITDATLKMVMNNQALISDIGSTMREWIILTCTKFMLDLPLPALCILFEISEQECEKIVQKTCLFLRKTLSLPDCQRYVWLLPTKVISGIADFSDKLLMDNN